jgi:hypothetical protein
MSDLPTPESDNFEKNFPDAPVSGWKRLARRFERERDEAREYSASLTDEYLSASGMLQAELSSLRGDLGELKTLLKSAYHNKYDDTIKTQWTITLTMTDGEVKVWDKFMNQNEALTKKERE